MKRIIFLITSLLLVGCYEENFLSIPYIKGNLYSKEDNKPIAGAAIYINRYLLYENSPKGDKQTDKEGYFYVEGLITHKRSSMEKTYCREFFIRKDSIVKILDLDEKRYEKCMDRDTFNLGILYFEDLKSVKLGNYEYEVIEDTITQ